MIVCHPLQVIFIKTKKVAGTSFEIALSQFCSPACMITPISPADETIRENAGFRGPQNYLEYSRTGVTDPQSPNFQFFGDYENHDSASYLLNNCASAMLHSYTKVTIHRDPLDFLISQYYFKMRTKTAEKRPDFAHWVQANRVNVLENYQIAPRRGAAACDVVLRYEHLQQDISAFAPLPDQFSETFASLSAKSEFRPQSSRDVQAFFNDHNVDTAEILSLLDGQP